MKGKTIFQAALIILLVTLVIILGSIPEKTAWAGADFQTVPTAEATPTPPGGDGGTSWWQENIGLICGIGFLVLLGGGTVGGLLAWWIARGNKNRMAGPGSPGDGFEPPV